MDQNRENPTDTGKQQVYALTSASRWLKAVGGDSRLAAAIDVLLDATVTALERGESPPWKASVDLASGADAMGHSTDGEDARLRGSQLERWWEARQNQINESLREAGCLWTPRLLVERGGGRGNPTRFRFALDPLSSQHGNDLVAESEVSAPGCVTYRIDPAEPAYWFRMIIGRKPFAVRSLRGYILVATVIGDVLLIGGMWMLVLHQWTSVRQIVAIDLVIAALAGIITWALLALSRPIRLLVHQRVSIANDALLSISTFHAQLRMQRDPKRKLGGSTFSFVRHWGNCPICAAEVDLDDGGRAFPDRIIGRCSDAPLEHVFSFDPVRLIGEPLYAIRRKSGHAAIRCS
jgi:hypothetical protein